MMTALLLGVSYGIVSGVSPGPTLGLVITQTLQRGWHAGNVIALAPLITDLPIILLAFFVIRQLLPGALGWLGIAGGLFVIYLGVETLRTARGRGDASRALGDQILQAQSVPGDGLWASLWRGVVVNALNPHPYLFWATVGGPLLVSGYEASGLLGAGAFLIGFYGSLVGSKLLLALAIYRSRRWLHGRAYQRILTGSGVALIGLGLLLAADGFSMLL